MENGNSFIEEPVLLCANFALGENYPLVKTKFGVYICTYVALERMIRDISLLRELKPATVRYDPGWGFGNDQKLNSPRELDAPQISGSLESLKINFAGFDKLTDTLHAGHFDMMYVHAYNPLPLQEDSLSNGNDFSSNLKMYSNWNTKPKDMDAWKRINEDYARHWREKGCKVKYYEIWNEPDLQPVFFNGPKEDYFEIYKYGSQGVKQGDPDAMVGGPAISFNVSWVVPFLDYVKENSLPLDFFSFHTYGEPSRMIEEIRNILKDREELCTVDTLITEYNSYIPATKDFTTNGAIERYEAASQLLHDFKYFLEQPDIKTIYWAQYDDPEVFGEGVDRCGMINLDGHKKATFNAFKIYADMPVERKHFISSCKNIEGIASSEEHEACVALWNMSQENYKIQLRLEAISFKTGDLSVYRIDADHASYIDNPGSEELEVVEQHKVQTQNLVWQGYIPARGVVYITIKDLEYNKEGERKWDKDIARIHRVKYYYPNREKKCYAEFDPDSWTAYLGMANEEDAYALVGVFAEILQDKFKISFDIDGQLKHLNFNSLIGFRIDFMEDGTYTKGVLFHAGIYDSDKKTVLPWGTKRLPDQVINVNDLSGFQINLAEYAPKRWDSKHVVFSFEMQNAGVHARVKIKVDKL